MPDVFHTADHHKHSRRWTLTGLTPFLISKTILIFAHISLTFNILSVVHTLSCEVRILSHLTPAHCRIMGKRVCGLSGAAVRLRAEPAQQEEDSAEGAKHSSQVSQNYLLKKS